MSLGSQISHIATNKGNIKRQCSIYNILSLKYITLDNKHWKYNSDLQTKTLNPHGQLTHSEIFIQIIKNKASVSTCRTQQI